jgi:hypothetical protein
LDREKKNSQSDINADAFHLLEALNNRVQRVQGIKPAKPVIRSSYEVATIRTGIYALDHLDGGETLPPFLSPVRAHQRGDLCQSIHKLKNGRNCMSQ